MPCPTCSHTLQSLCASMSGELWYWCPRCGTLRMVRGDFTGDQMPSLVERCREIETAAVLDCPVCHTCWHTLGIKEAIHA